MFDVGMSVFEEQVGFVIHKYLNCSNILSD
jgi:hypothetical protein